MDFIYNTIQLLYEWGPNFMRGTIATLQIAFGSYLLGILIGTFGAIGKLYGGRGLRLSLSVYTTLIRAVPELILILLIYYAGTSLLNTTLESLGFGTVDISGVAAGIIVIGIVQGAYQTEVIRGALISVPKQETDAGIAFGMSRTKVFRRILIPAMIPLALPGMANLWMICTKETALLAVVGFEELALVTKQAAGKTRLFLEAFTVAMFLYLCITLASNVIFKAIEKRTTRGHPKLDKQ
ncbi:ABC transporter permease subunit [uncultured Lentibacter sp.]|uniref:ABC transporter permease n=1 Tax=uncultured Lentibacter sp. TaxID=1659309 RepID=UPI00262D5F59|nr:ABC transporter permease subunit [uncultured Lentibacter sp.]MCW1955816.1 ABC transporter permease subunit [Roseobacter sp.]